MVFRGRPSRGCGVCRKASVKCDERRPKCSRCSRLKKACIGYRQLDGLAVFDETENTKFKCLRRQERYDRRLGHLDFNLSPESLGEDTIVWYFYSITMATLSELDHSYHLHAELPKMYTKSLTRSALRLSTQAIAHAAATQAGRSTMGSARKSYLTAVSAVSTALQDPCKAVEDETLYAVLLLCGYETITCESHELTGWAAHVKGTAALLSHRSKWPSTSDFSSKLLRYARRSIIMCQIQIGIPTTALFAASEGPFPPDQNDVDRLYSLMARLSDLQHYSRTVDLLPPTNKRSQSNKLLTLATFLLNDFLNWKSDLPSAWAYGIVRDLRDSITSKSNLEFVLLKIHKYPDTYIARLWNLYRTSCIILYFIIIRAGAHQEPEARSNYGTHRASSMQADVLELVNEICASVPYLCGEDFNIRSVTRTKHANSQDRKQSLLWPLYVASSVYFLSDPQRIWIRHQILAMAKSGEPLASQLLNAQSQVLRGGTEQFAFDCV